MRPSGNIVLTAWVMVLRAVASSPGCIELIAITKRPVRSDHAGGQVHPVAADAAHPALLDRDRFGEQALGDAEPLRVHAAGHHTVDRHRRRRRQVGQNDVGPLRRQPAGAAEQHVVVAHEVGGRADGVEPAAVVRASRRAQPVARHHSADDRAAAAAVPEHLGGAVVGGPQHDVERCAIGGGELGLALRLLQQQVVGDEQLDHRGDRDRHAVAVGDDLAGVAVQHHGRDVGTGAGGVGGGLPGPGPSSPSNVGGWLVRRGFRQRSHPAQGRDDGQLRGRGPGVASRTPWLRNRR